MRLRYKLIDLFLGEDIGDLMYTIDKIVRKKDIVPYVIIGSAIKYLEQKYGVKSN